MANQHALSAILCLFFSWSLYAQKANIPTIVDSTNINSLIEWVGKYEGSLEIYNTKGKKIAETKMTMIIKPIEGTKNSWQWKTIYAKNEQFPETIKDYQLIQADSLDANHFILDEKNDILLDIRLIDNCLYGAFDVAGSKLVSLDRKEGKTIYHEIISYSSDKTRETSTVFSGNTFNVVSYLEYNTQKAVLNFVEE